MKIHSLIVAKQPLSNARQFFFLTFLPSYETWKRSETPTKNAIRKVLTHCLIFLIITVLYYYFYWAVRDSFEVSRLGIAYLAAPMLWLIGEWVTSLLQITSLVTGRLIPRHHNFPIISKNLTEFWGERWNTWFNDWFYQVCFKAYRRNPLKGIMYTFLMSGIGHEIVISLPFYTLTGINLFGSMSAFFLLQGVGVIIDNKAFKKKPAPYRFIFMWFWLLASAPLFMNEGTLRLVHAIR